MTPFEAIAEPNRRRILELIGTGEMSAGDLVTETGFSQPGVSKHLRHLREAGVVRVRADGQKVLLAIRSMGGESEAAWRALLDDLVKRGLQTPDLVIADGATGLEKALAALWPRRAGPTLHGAQAPQSPRPCARAAA